MIPKEREKIAYPVKKLDGPITDFYKYQFKVSEALALIEDEKLKREWLDYHGLEEHIHKHAFFFDVPSGLRAIIRISKNGIPRMFYQQMVYKKSLEINHHYKNPPSEFK